MNSSTALTLATEILSHRPHGLPIESLLSRMLDLHDDADRKTVAEAVRALTKQELLLVNQSGNISLNPQMTVLRSAVDISASVMENGFIWFSFLFFFSFFFFNAHCEEN
jgi:hypothetical protein